MVSHIRVTAFYGKPEKVRCSSNTDVIDEDYVLEQDDIDPGNRTDLPRRQKATKNIEYSSPEFVALNSIKSANNNEIYMYVLNFCTLACANNALLLMLRVIITDLLVKSS